MLTIATFFCSEIGALDPTAPVQFGGNPLKGPACFPRQSPDWSTPFRVVLAPFGGFGSSLVTPWVNSLEIDYSLEPGAFRLCANSWLNRFNSKTWMSFKLFKIFLTLDSGCPGSPAKFVRDECHNDIVGSPLQKVPQTPQSDVPQVSLPESRPLANRTIFAFSQPIRKSASGPGSPDSCMSGQVSCAVPTVAPPALRAALQVSRTFLPPPRHD